MKEGDIIRVSGDLTAYVLSVDTPNRLATVAAHGFKPFEVDWNDAEVLPPTPLQTYKHVMNEIDRMLMRRIMGP